MQIIYAVLCIVGTLLSLTQFIPWLADHGLNISLLIQQALAAPISAFAWSNVVVSALIARNAQVGMVGTPVVFAYIHGSSVTRPKAA